MCPSDQRYDKEKAQPYKTLRLLARENDCTWPPERILPCYTPEIAFYFPIKHCSCHTLHIY